MEEGKWTTTSARKHQEARSEMGHKGFHFIWTWHDAHAWDPSTQKVEKGRSGVQDHHSPHREDILGYPKSVSERDQGRERGGFMFPNQNCSVEKNSPYSLPLVNYKINIFLHKELLRNHLLRADLEGPGPPSPASISTSRRKPMQIHNPHLLFLSSFAVAWSLFSLRHFSCKI